MSETDGCSMEMPRYKCHKEVWAYMPRPGDYYIVYHDGYKSISPARAFEEGYSRVSR